MRRPDWVSRLNSVRREYQRRGFSFGEHDCALFAARCVDAVTGSNLSPTLGYQNKRSAVKVLRSEGGLESGVSKRLGVPIVGHNARRGDVCQIDEKTLGVCFGPTIAVLTDNKIVDYPLARATKHWRVE